MFDKQGDQHLLTAPEFHCNISSLMINRFATHIEDLINTNSFSNLGLHYINNVIKCSSSYVTSCNIFL